MQRLSVTIPCVVLLAWGSCPCLAYRSRLRSRLPQDIDPNNDDLSPLHSIEDMTETAEDLEKRQKPPHMLPQFGNENLPAANLIDLLGAKRDDLEDCILIHQYAEPLMVSDAVREPEVSLSSNDTGEVPPVVRQGAVWDESAESKNITLAVEVFAHLEGITGLVQVIAHGTMASWTSKMKVPVGGFLCSYSHGVPSAPVLHATPTPCIPTAIDTTGQPLDPLVDGYEVFIGTTRVRFDNKSIADRFCEEYTQKIASDLKTTIWDASSLGPLLPGKNPSVTSFVSLTGHRSTPEGWTMGRKKLLVVVMDWMEGDTTLAPYSKQDPNPIPTYQSKIFPAVNKHFEDMSYGQFGVDVTVVPQVIRYTRERNRYTVRKMPFPALFDAAKESLEGQRGDYLFDSYDLVFVIAPQVQPTGTKGVAWVGMKGAMCNGCETISDNFKIMVAVHELGHNLGLLHASSTALEYGNPFDWMGNYPEVVGLNYGVGYVWSLGWLKDDFIYKVTDANLPGLSTIVMITPYDVYTKPSQGQVRGVQVSLSGAKRDFWVEYRASPERQSAGVFLTRQEKNEAHSQLIDTACHSPSQQDATLRVGWIYLDSTQKVAVKVIEVTEQHAKVMIFEVNAADVPKIYGQDTFTDGETKCPVTCQDANWLVSQYSCDSLKSQGYCKGGSITMQDHKYSIGMDICPQACGTCDAVLKNTPLTVQGGCQDRNMMISGKNCAEVAQAGWCGYGTAGGASVGKDICPASCGACHKKISPSNAPFTMPSATRSVGMALADGGAQLLAGEPAPAPYSAVAPAPMVALAPMAAPPAPVDGDEDDDDDDNCTDDSDWKDEDGDTCAEYAKIIDDGTWTQDRACNYKGGDAKMHCRQTCDSCAPSSSTCDDRDCISAFKRITGRCEQCADWSRYCKGITASWFKVECPRTCGVCSPAEVNTTKPRSNKAKCVDEKCIAAWKTRGKCPTCSELGNSFCSEKVFATACPQTCNLCGDGQSACRDVFAGYTCSRYKQYGWCTRKDTRVAVEKQCAETCGFCNQRNTIVNASHSNATDANTSNDTQPHSGASSLLAIHLVTVIIATIGLGLAV